MNDKPPLLSIIIPTYNERDNIPKLLARIHSALHTIDYEVIIVDDDSPDRTWEVAEKLSSIYPVRVLRRINKRGLGSAVVDGFKIARGKVLGVMDADLQHPPEKILELLSAIENGADIAIASRYVEGGEIENWGLRRKIISKGATTLVHILIPTFKQIKDPLSGFFLVRRGVVEGIELNPHGFKILLEILAKGKYSSVIEVPYKFKERELGESKLNFKEYAKYLRQLWNTISQTLPSFDLKKILLATAFSPPIISFSLCTFLYLTVLSHIVSSTSLMLLLLMQLSIITSLTILLLETYFLAKNTVKKGKHDILSVAFNFWSSAFIASLLVSAFITTLMPIHPLVVMISGLLSFSVMQSILVPIIIVRYTTTLAFSSRPLNILPHTQYFGRWEFPTASLQTSFEHALIRPTILTNMRKIMTIFCIK